MGTLFSVVHPEKNIPVNRHSGIVMEVSFTPEEGWPLQIEIINYNYQAHGAISCS